MIASSNATLLFLPASLSVVSPCAPHNQGLYVCKFDTILPDLLRLLTACFELLPLYYHTTRRPLIPSLQALLILPPPTLFSYPPSLSFVGVQPPFAEQPVARLNSPHPYHPVMLNYRWWLNRLPLSRPPLRLVAVASPESPTPRPHFPFTRLPNDALATPVLSFAVWSSPGCPPAVLAAPRAPCRRLF